MNYFDSVGFGEFIKIIFFGIRFDISALYYFNLLFILFSIIPGNFKNNKSYQSFLIFTFILINSLLLATNFVDTKFFDFEHKRLTADIFSSVWLGEDFRTLLPDFIKDFWYLILIWLLLCFGIYKLYPKLSLKHLKKDFLSFKNLISHSIIFILLMGIGLVFGRGGFQLKPLRVIHASEYTSAKNIPLILNTPFTIMKTFGRKSVTPVRYFDEEKLDSLYSPVKKYEPTSQNKTNIVILILESFSAEYTGFLNNGSGYTPFLDSLSQHSLVYTKAFANGKRSIEAMPSIIAGLPALTDDTYITSQYSSNNINSIASILTDNGYYTAFFHGGKNGTMGFDQFANVAGIQHYYGMNEYPNDSDKDGNWGIYDEEYLQYFSRTMSEFTEPFFTSVFTLTSHHPYEIPKKYNGKFPEGTLNIHESIGYTDYSVKKFFESAKKTDWYNNTLFIITADHTAQAENSYYKNKIGNYAVPILFYHPSDTLFQGQSNTVAQQTDVLPTILDYLGYDKPFISFGNSLLNDSTDHFAVNYINGIYQLVKDDYVIHFDGAKTIAVYNFRLDSLLQNNIIDQKSEYQNSESFLKAILQSYQERLVENKLSTK
jgi:phosphoglycerol transferase MdoB-like AlkP superfamily enzyme